jgi:hypothetical protein
MLTLTAISKYLLRPSQARWETLVRSVRMQFGALPAANASGAMVHYSDYLRDEAAKYRALAAEAVDAISRQELLNLAGVCEEAANDIDDRGRADSKQRVLALRRAWLPVPACGDNQFQQARKRRETVLRSPSAPVLSRQRL